jgi:hypothetical protein
MIKFLLGFACGCLLVLVLSTPICTYCNFWITLLRNELEKENRFKFCKKLILERKLLSILKQVKNSDLTKTIEFVSHQLWRL